MIETYRDLLNLIDKQRGIAPSVEALVIKAYIDIFGLNDKVKEYADCKCPGHIKYFYSELKKKLNDYDRTRTEEN